MNAVKSRSKFESQIERDKLRDGQTEIHKHRAVYKQEIYTNRDIRKQTKRNSKERRQTKRRQTAKEIRRDKKRR